MNAATFANQAAIRDRLREQGWYRIPKSHDTSTFYQDREFWSRSPSSQDDDVIVGFPTPTTKVEPAKVLVIYWECGLKSSRYVPAEDMAHTYETTVDGVISSVAVLLLTHQP